MASCTIELHDDGDQVRADFTFAGGYQAESRAHQAAGMIDRYMGTVAEQLGDAEPIRSPAREIELPA